MNVSSAEGGDIMGGLRSGVRNSNNIEVRNVLGFHLVRHSHPIRLRAQTEGCEMLVQFRVLHAD